MNGYNLIKMKLEYNIDIPSHYGQIVKDYLKVLTLNKEYDVYSLNDNLEIIRCKGIIKNNESWNYHNNYDDSENELYIIYNKHIIKKWFSLNREDVEEIQQKNIKNWQNILNKELLRLKQWED